MKLLSLTVLMLLLTSGAFAANSKLSDKSMFELLLSIKKNAPLLVLSSSDTNAEGFRSTRLSMSIGKESMSCLLDVDPEGDDPSYTCDVTRSIVLPAQF